MPGRACRAHDLRDPGGKHSKRSIPAGTTELILAELRPPPRADPRPRRAAGRAALARVLVLLQ